MIEPEDDDQPSDEDNGEGPPDGTNKGRANKVDDQGQPSAALEAGEENQSRREEARLPGGVDGLLEPFEKAEKRTDCKEERSFSV